jgi:hypothetical protein
VRSTDVFVRKFFDVRDGESVQKRLMRKKRGEKKRGERKEENEW